MRVLVACEYSGRVREAFRARGHDAVSVDLIEAEDDSPHHRVGDVLPMLTERWDMLIAFPPCTYLCRSGIHWNKTRPERAAKSEAALEFVRALMSAPIPRIAIENPIGIISSRIRKPDCIVQPWQHGTGETKATCLWLRGLPILKPTCIVDGRKPAVHYAAPGPNRWKERSRTVPGIAAAMAGQWG